MSANPTGESKGRVLQWRPRGSYMGQPSQQPPSPVEDLVKYERPENAADYRHRMVVNVLAFAFTVGLIVIGFWIADTMAHMRKNQDCVLTGRHACAPIDAPVTPRY